MESLTQVQTYDFIEMQLSSPGRVCVGIGRAETMYMLADATRGEEVCSSPVVVGVAPNDASGTSGSGPVSQSNIVDRAATGFRAVSSRTITIESAVYVDGGHSVVDPTPTGLG